MLAALKVLIKTKFQTYKSKTFLYIFLIENEQLITSYTTEIILLLYHNKPNPKYNLFLKNVD